MREEEVIAIYKAMSAGSRLQILKLLCEKKQLCVNAITHKLDISQSAVSQHLAILKKAGLVTHDRYGSIVHYALNRGRLDDFKASVKRILGSDFILLEDK